MNTNSQKNLNYICLSKLFLYFLKGFTNMALFINGIGGYGKTYKNRLNQRIDKILFYSKNKMNNEIQLLIVEEKMYKF